MRAEQSRDATGPTGDAAAVIAAAGLNLEAKEPKPQCLPAGRGTAVVTKDHDGVAIAAGDAAAVIAAAELDLEARSPNHSACQQAEAPQSSPMTMTALPLPQVILPQS